MTSQPHFLKDLEVREMQSLDHAKLATAVFEGIQLCSPPCRLALFGPWGAGKSTILKLLEREVDLASADGQGDYYRTFWFNAWEHESSANLFFSLVAMLVQQIPDGVRYSKKGSAVVRRVLEAARIHGRRFGNEAATESARRLTSPSEEEDIAFLGLDSMRGDIERFCDMLLVSGGKERNRRVLVFVDDVDKCLPLHSLAMLESLKLFFRGPAPIIFVCSVDAEVLSHVVRSKYGHGDSRFAESYIEKIFEFGFEVPVINTIQVSELVDEIFKRSGLSNRAVPADQIDLERQVLDEVLSRPGLTLNPRKIKRIFNRFIWFLCHTPSLDEAAATSDRALNLWLSWLLATDYWRELREFVGRYGEIAFRELGNRIAGHPLFPHSNDGAKQAVNTMAGGRALIEFLRTCVSVPTDPHLAESQEEMREAIMKLQRIDGLLRSYGL